MPLRDHFHPPVENIASWEELHAMWPADIVKQLRKQLPEGYVAGPRVHLGPLFEIDIAAYEKDDARSNYATDEGEGGVATAVSVPPVLSVSVETELAEYDEYEVRIYDATRGRTLVAAIEIVSPANKDRPEKRNAFVGKCAALLQKGVAVSIVDVVTIRQFNLHAEVMAFIGHPDPTMNITAPHLYASSTRWVTRGKRNFLEAWSQPLTLGQPLPTLPLWLSETLVVSLDLETCYEQTCRDLWIA